MPYSHCPICDAPAAEPFFRLDAAPALCHRLCRSQAEALAQPKGPIELTLCRRCGLVFNQAFDSGRIVYDGAYENALHFSGVFREYAKQLADSLVRRYGVTGGTVAEIGCGDGQFLAALCEAGAGGGLGFDPAFDRTRHDPPGDGNIRILPELFDASALRDADVGLICCRHVLEHIETPTEFVGGLREAVGSRRVPVYFEVPSALHSLERRGFWDIIYEHVTYFTSQALRTLFERAGFDVERTQEAYAKQFLSVEAISGNGNPRALPDAGEIASLETLAAQFGAEYAKLADAWRRRLSACRAGGKPCLVWGAGSKTVMFLNNLGVDTETVSGVVDRNPRKHGCFIVGTGQPIIAPDDVRALDPDVVILMNPAYEAEVKADLSALGCSAELALVA